MNQHDFETALPLLYEALIRCRCHHHDIIVDWSIETSNRHEPRCSQLVGRCWRKSNRQRQQQQETSADEGSCAGRSPRSDDLLDEVYHIDRAKTLVDESSSALHADDDCVVMDTNGRNNDGWSTTRNDSANYYGRWMIRWVYSIVYSPTWQAPVLYFTAESSVAASASSDGPGDSGNNDAVLPLFLSRRQVLQELNHDAAAVTTTGDSCDEDSWNFVSAEEHPMTGLPSFFLHPCQTADCLSTIMTTPSSPPSLTASTTSPAVRHDNDDDDGIVQAAHRLWAWCALVLPAAGLVIPPATYVKVRHDLEHHHPER
jgi:hypothetical protein